MIRFGRLILIVFMIGAAALVTQAQTAVTLDQPAQGTISAELPQATFIFTAAAGQTVDIQVIATTPGMANQFSVLTGAGALVGSFDNPGGAGAVSGTVTFAEAGPYQIVVGSSNNVFGQFVLLVTGAAAAVPPTPLTLGQPVESQIAAGETQRYSFSADPVAPLNLRVSGTGFVGVTATLSDGNGAVLGSLTSGLIGGVFIVPPGIASFTVDVTNDLPGGQTIPYLVVLEASASAEIAAATPTATLASGQLPTLPTTGACVVATAADTGVNIRSGPDLAFEPPIGSMLPQEIYTVAAQTPGGGWYLINFGGGQGWVAASVTRSGGDCSAVPVNSGPPLPNVTAATATPTGVTGATATPTSPTGPTATPTSPTGPTATPTMGATTIPMPTATQMPTDIPPASTPEV